MAGPVKILVIRFSAMGDVAMAQPVLKEFTAAYPQIELLVVIREENTRGFLACTGSLKNSKHNRSLR
jgi:ADP-heptose:LPS heptosyltransferase